MKLLFIVCSLTNQGSEGFETDSSHLGRYNDYFQLHPVCVGCPIHCKHRVPELCQAIDLFVYTRQTSLNSLSALHLKMFLMLNSFIYLGAQILMYCN